MSVTYPQICTAHFREQDHLVSDTQQPRTEVASLPLSSFPGMSSSDSSSFSGFSETAISNARPRLSSSDELTGFHVPLFTSASTTPLSHPFIVEQRNSCSSSRIPRAPSMHPAF